MSADVAIVLVRLSIERDGVGISAAAAAAAAAASRRAIRSRDTSRAATEISVA